jgi:hypothetical protein
MFNSKRIDVLEKRINDLEKIINSEIIIDNTILKTVMPIDWYPSNPFKNQSVSQVSQVLFSLQM